MITFKNKKAFTLVEILIASAVTVIFLGMAISMFMRFSSYFSAGEGSAALMQECALFTARLRNDMNNAVRSQNGHGITIDGGQIMFNVYDSEEGRLKPVIYSAIPVQGGYYNMTRRIANEDSHTIVKGNVASFSWHLLEESIPTGATPVKRIGLELYLNMGSPTMKNKSFEYRTIIFPVRINRG